MRRAVGPLLRLRCAHTVPHATAGPLPHVRVGGTRPAAPAARASGAKIVGGFPNAPFPVRPILSARGPRPHRPSDLCRERTFRSLAGLYLDELNMFPQGTVVCTSALRK